VAGLTDGVGGICLWMGGEKREERIQKTEFRMSNDEVRLPRRFAPRNDGGEYPRRLRLLRIFLDAHAPAEYNIYQTNITESHKQKNRKQNMPDRKIKPHHHPAGRSFRFPLSVRLFVPLCLSGQDPRSTLVETPLQISLFFAKQTQFQNGQYNHKYSNNKVLYK